MSHLRHSLVAAAAALGLAVTGAPASAAPSGSGGPPARSTFTLPGPVPFGPCPEAGEITELTVERKETTFTQRDGTETRAVAFVSFTGTLTGVNGREIPYRGHFEVTDDFRRGVSVTTGLNGRAVLPDGEVVLAAGRRVVDLGTGEESAAGANTFTRFVDQICAALAA